MTADRAAARRAESLERRTLCIDIDRTIYAGDRPLDYENGAAVPGAADALRKLRDDGWTIVLYTARHFNHWEVTRRWLDHAGICYDQIVFGKPPATYYIDDRAIPFRGSWDAVLRAIDHGCDPGAA